MSSSCYHNFGNLFHSSLSSLEDPSQPGLPAQSQHAEQIVQVSYFDSEKLSPKEPSVTPELIDLAPALPPGEVSSRQLPGQQRDGSPCSPPCRTGARSR